MTAQDASGRLVYANDAARRIFGVREIKDQNSATISELAEISNSLGQCLEILRTADLAARDDAGV